MNSLSLLLCFSVFLSVSACFFGSSSGGGGGGGCGGGCQSSCGGRKKRSIDMPPPPFLGLAAGDKDLLCNTPELRQTITENMRETADQSGRAISAALEQLGDRFVVICSEKPFSYFVRHDTEFCGTRNGTHYCQAFAL